MNEVNASKGYSNIILCFFMKKFIASILFFIFSAMPFCFSMEEQEKPIDPPKSAKGIVDGLNKFKREWIKFLSKFSWVDPGELIKADEELSKNIKNKNSVLFEIPIIRTCAKRFINTKIESRVENERIKIFSSDIAPKNFKEWLVKFWKEHISFFGGEDKKTWLGVGLHKRDIPRLGIIATHLFSEYMFHKKALQNRVDFTCEKILEDPNKLLEQLFAAEADKDFRDFFYEEKKKISPWTGKVIEPQALKDLKKYLNETYSVGLFDKNMILPTALKFGQQELMPRFIERQYSDERSKPEFYFSYKKDSDGNLTEINHPVLSVVNFVKLLPYIGLYLNVHSESFTAKDFFKSSGSTFMMMLPFIFLLSGIVPGVSYLKNFYDASSWMKEFSRGALSKIPKVGETLAKFAFDPKVHLFLYRTAVFLGAIKILNNIYTNYWTKYVIKNRQELIKILMNYRKKVDQFDESDEAKQKIIDFVKKAYDFKKSRQHPFGDLYTWFVSKNRANMYLPEKIAWATVIALYAAEGYFLCKVLKGDWVF